jgi:hypothetical protein
MVVSDVALGGLSKALDGLKSVISDSITFSKQADKASLALGMSFGQASDRLGGSMEGLRGSLNERFTASLMTLESGLTGNTQGVASLVNQQRLTGQGTAKTLKAMTALEFQLGASREDTNQLSVDLIETSKHYGVSTDLLVGAIASMESSFGAMNLAGMGSEVTQAVANLQANLGPAMAGPLNDMMKNIMDTSEEGFASLVKLNVGGVREQLSAAKTSEEATQILRGAIETMAATTTDFAGGSENFFRMTGVTTEALGAASMNSVKLAEAFDQRADSFGMASAEFSEQIDVMKGEALEPLQTLFAEMFNQIKPFLPAISEFVSTIFQNFADKIRDGIAKLGGFEGVVDAVKLKFEEIKPHIIAFGEKILQFFTEDIGRLKNIVIGVTAAFLALQVAALIPLKILLAGFVLGLKAIGVAFALMTTPIGLVVTGVVALGALLYKFGAFDPIIEGVKNGFSALKRGLGSLLESFGELVPDWLGGGKLTEMGQALKESTEANTQVANEMRVTNTASTGPASREDALAIAIQSLSTERQRLDRYTNDERYKNQAVAADIRREARHTIGMKERELERLRAMTDEQYQEQAAQRDNQQSTLQQVENAAAATATAVENIDKKTPSEDTGPTFLDETANMLGRSIEAILGITVNDDNGSEQTELLAAAVTELGTLNGKINQGPILT